MTSVTMLAILTLTVMLACLFSSGDALSCIVCSSEEEGCKDPYARNATHLKPDCGYCLKVKTETGDDQIVVRMCSAKSIIVPEMTCHSGKSGSTWVSTCTCADDGCNGGQKVTLTLGSLLGLLLLVTLL